MKYTIDELKEKILEMYPEIKGQKLSAGVKFDARRNAYHITFTRGKESLDTYLEVKDADDCMNGVKCVYLGVQVTQFLNNFEERVVYGKETA